MIRRMCILLALALLASCGMAAAEAAGTADEAQRMESGKLNAYQPTDDELLTIRVATTDIILGKTTPEDMALEDDWIFACEGDGVFSVSTGWGVEGLMIATENGGMNEPILTVNTMWMEGAFVYYYEFDGIVGISIDGDDDWYPGGMTEEKLTELLDGEGARINLWDGFGNWLTTAYGGIPDENGIISAVIPLSSGQELYVSTHDSSPRISLAGF